MLIRKTCTLCNRQFIGSQQKTTDLCTTCVNKYLRQRGNALLKKHVGSKITDHFSGYELCIAFPKEGSNRLS